MPDTYFTRKEAIAHGEAIDPITREEALIQKAATPLSVKDAALYALKNGSGPDIPVTPITIRFAQSLIEWASTKGGKEKPTIQLAFIGAIPGEQTFGLQSPVLVIDADMPNITMYVTGEAFMFEVADVYPSLFEDYKQTNLTYSGLNGTDDPYVFRINRNKSEHVITIGVIDGGK